MPSIITPPDPPRCPGCGGMLSGDQVEFDREDK